MRGRRSAYLALAFVLCGVGTGAHAQPRAAVPVSTTTLASGTSAATLLQATQVPFVRLSDDELQRHVASDLGSLGSLSVGRPYRGALVNAVRMPEGEHWELVKPRCSWATQETVQYLAAAIEQVNVRHPGAHKLYIGHLSREHGGPLRPHRSHQSGRDVDVSYYYRPDKAEWYRPATAGTLDVARTWAFVRALLTETDLEMAFIDIRVQKMLKEHALAIGEDRTWINSVFEYNTMHLAPLVRHAYGHRTHIHIRFYNPRAQELGRRCHSQLVAAKVIGDRRYYALKRDWAHPAVIPPRRRPPTPAEAAAAVRRRLATGASQIAGGSVLGARTNK